MLHVHATYSPRLTHLPRELGVQKREEQDQPRLALAELAGQHLVCKRVVPHEAPPGAPRQLDRARRLPRR